MSEWKTYKLGEIAKIVSRGISPKYAEVGVPVINQKCVREGKIKFYDIKFNDVSLKKVSEEKYLLKNDILVNSTGTGTLGRVGQINFEIGEFTYDSHVTLVRIDESFDQVFVGYKLKSLQSYIESMAEGSTGQTELNREKLKQLEITIPINKAEQSQIAQILTSLDDKIELNLQMNQTLEAMAQALFKEWFVNFNFPGFDGELENGLPKGWRMGKLGDISSNFDSKRIPLSSMQRKDRQGIYPYYGAATIFDYIDDYIFDGTYLLMGEDGTVQTDEGFPVLQYVWGKFWVNNHTHVLQGKNLFSTEYLYLLLSKTNIIHLITGAVQPKINQGNMNKIECVLPTGGILNDFQEVICPIFEKIKSNKTQIQTLTQTRDTLLPKLMSGKVKINCTEYE